MSSSSEGHDADPVFMNEPIELSAAGLNASNLNPGERPVVTASSRTVSSSRKRSNRPASFRTNPYARSLAPSRKSSPPGGTLDTPSEFMCSYTEAHEDSDTEYIAGKYQDFNAIGTDVTSSLPAPQTKSTEKPPSKYAHLGYTNIVAEKRRELSAMKLASGSAYMEEFRSDWREARDKSLRDVEEERLRPEILKRIGEQQAKQLVETMREEVIARFEKEYREKIRNQMCNDMGIITEQYRVHREATVNAEISRRLEPVVTARLERDKVDEVMGLLKGELKPEVIHNLKVEFEESVKNELRDEVKVQLRKDLEDDVCRQIREEKASWITDELMQELKERHTSQVVKELRDELRDEVKVQLHKELEEDVCRHIRGEKTSRITHQLMQEFKELHTPRVVKELRDEHRDQVLENLKAELTPSVTRSLKHELKPLISKELRQELAPTIANELRNQPPATIADKSATAANEPRNADIQTIDDGITSNVNSLPTVDNAAAVAEESLDTSVQTVAKRTASSVNSPAHADNAASVAEESLDTSTQAVGDSDTAATSPDGLFNANIQTVANSTTSSVNSPTAADNAATVAEESLNTSTQTLGDSDNAATAAIQPLSANVHTNPNGTTRPVNSRPIADNAAVVAEQSFDLKVPRNGDSGNAVTTAYEAVDTKAQAILESGKGVTTANATVKANVQNTSDCTTISATAQIDYHSAIDPALASHTALSALEEAQNNAHRIDPALSFATGYRDFRRDSSSDSSASSCSAIHQTAYDENDDLYLPNDQPAAKTPSEGFSPISATSKDFNGGENFKVPDNQAVAGPSWERNDSTNATSNTLKRRSSESDVEEGEDDDRASKRSRDEEYQVDGDVGFSEASGVDDFSSGYESGSEIGSDHQGLADEHGDEEMSDYGQDAQQYYANGVVQYEEEYEKYDEEEEEEEGEEEDDSEFEELAYNDGNGAGGVIKYGNTRETAIELDDSDDEEEGESTLVEEGGFVAINKMKEATTGGGEVGGEGGRKPSG